MKPHLPSTSLVDDILTLVLRVQTEILLSFLDDKTKEDRIVSSVVELKASHESRTVFKLQKHPETMMDHRGVYAFSEKALMTFSSIRPLYLSDGAASSIDASIA